MPENFGDDMYAQLTVPDVVPLRDARAARRDARLEHRLAFTNLEFALNYLTVADQPKLFIGYDKLRDERRTALIVPLGHVGIHQKSIFVGVNIESPLPERLQTRQLRATAYKFDVRARQICQYPEKTAESVENGAYWEFDEDFGPLIDFQGNIAGVACWDGLRLQLPTEDFDKISVESARQRSMATQLARLLHSYDSRRDARTFSLIPGKW